MTWRSSPESIGFLLYLALSGFGLTIGIIGWLVTQEPETDFDEGDHDADAADAL